MKALRREHPRVSVAARVPTQMISPPSARPPPFDRGKPRQVGEVCRRNAPLLTSLHFTASQREETVKVPPPSGGYHVVYTGDLVTPRAVLKAVVGSHAGTSANARIVPPVLSEVYLDTGVVAFLPPS